MPISEYLHTQTLDATLRGVTFSAPSSTYVGLHLAATFSSDALIGETSISISNSLHTGAKMQLSSESEHEERAYVGSVTGSGPYTIELVDSGGSSYSLTENHSADEYIEFMPALSGSDTIEPSATEYSRVEVAADGTGWSKSSLIYSNTDNLEWVKAESGWGVATAFLIYDAATAGNLIWAYDATWNVSVDNKDTFIVEAGGLKIDKSKFE